MGKNSIARFFFSSLAMNKFFLYLIGFYVFMYTHAHNYGDGVLVRLGGQFPPSHGSSITCQYIYENYNMSTCKCLKK